MELEYYVQMIEADERYMTMRVRMPPILRGNRGVRLGPFVSVALFDQSLTAEIAHVHQDPMYWITGPVAVTQWVRHRVVTLATYGPRPQAPREEPERFEAWFLDPGLEVELGYRYPHREMTIPYEGYRIEARVVVPPAPPAVPVTDKHRVIIQPEE